MTKRPLIAAGLVAAALSTTLAVQRPAESQRGRPNATIGNVTLDVRRVTGSGRVRVLSLRVAPAAGTTVKSVSARAVLVSTGQGGSASRLANIEGSNFGSPPGTGLGVPTSARRTTARIEVTVSLTNGREDRTLIKSNAGTVSVDAFVGDPNSPPPPPPI
jgi:hypothetical protein